MFADFMGMDAGLMTAIVTGIGGFISTMAYKIWDRIGKAMDKLDERDMARNATLQAIQIDSAAKTELLRDHSQGIDRVESKVDSLAMGMGILKDRVGNDRPSGAVSQTIDASAGTNPPVRVSSATRMKPA